MTTIVQLDPMYVYFYMDESTLLKLRTAILQGKIKVPADGHLPVRLGLQTEEGFPHDATVTFMDNQVNSTTGSIPVRGVFRNPKFPPTTKVAGATGQGRKREKGGKRECLPRSLSPSLPFCPAPPRRHRHDPIDRLFSPGMYVRVRFPLGEPQKGCWSSTGPSSPTRGSSTFTSSTGRIRSRCAASRQVPAARRTPRGGGTQGQ